MITSAQLNSAMAEIIAGTASQTVALTTAYMCNTTANTVVVNVAVVPAGNNSPAECLIYNQLEIPALDTRIIDTEKLILGNGDSIWANTSVDGSVIMTVSSVGI